MSFHHIRPACHSLRAALRAPCVAAVAMALAWLALGSATRADVTAEGDVAPGAFDTDFDIWVPFDGLDVIEGGTVTGNIIVGGTDIPETGTVVGTRKLAGKASAKSSSPAWAPNGRSTSG
jgi:hypothetical protein